MTIIIIPQKRGNILFLFMTLIVVRLFTNLMIWRLTLKGACYHIVPLSLAHKWGAYLWTTQEKKAFANDIENLIMVSKVCNRIKSDKSLSEWMPKNIGYHVEYKKRFNYILQKYKLED